MELVINFRLSNNFELRILNNSRKSHVMNVELIQN